jgi:hypothetical protein
MVYAWLGEVRAAGGHFLKDISCKSARGYRNTLRGSGPFRDDFGHVECYPPFRTEQGASHEQLGCVRKPKASSEQHDWKEGAAGSLDSPLCYAAVKFPSVAVRPSSSPPYSCSFMQSLCDKASNRPCKRLGQGGHEDHCCRESRILQEAVAYGNG